MDKYILYTVLVFSAWMIATFICARYWHVDINRPSRSKVYCGSTICILTAIAAAQMSFYKEQVQMELSQEKYKRILNILNDNSDSNEKKERNDYHIKRTELMYDVTEIETNTYANAITNTLVNIVTIIGACIGGALLSLAIIERFNYRQVQLSKKDAYNKAFKRDS
ncbi:hypothetical protein VCSRO6_3456 [Vibrio cholerae]|nr:hypothetical protein VCSRO6_3456 [Vibrio cholerae]